MPPKKASPTPRRDSMFDTIAALMPADPDYAPRTARLSLYKRVQDGTLYDALPYEFQDERTASGEYIPLRQRRPSVHNSSTNKGQSPRPGQCM